MLSTTESEKAQMVRCITNIEAPRVLEIGAFQGATTRVLAQAAASRGGSVVVIDPMRWSAEFLQNGIRRHFGSRLNVLSRVVERALGTSGYERAFWTNVGEHRHAVQLHRTLSNDLDLIAREDAALAAFDVVFIDGDHGYEGAASDLLQWGARTVRGGTIFVHDATPAFPGVLSALAEFGRAHAVDVEYPSVDSLAVIRVQRAFQVTRPLAETSARVTNATGSRLVEAAS